MSELIYGYRKLAEAVDRNVSTVHEWVDNGCPVDKSGSTHVFDLDSVLKWMESRVRINSDDDDSEELKREQTRKLRLEGNKLDHDEHVRQGLYDSAHEFERVTALALEHITSAARCTFDDILSKLPPMPPERMQAIESMVADVLDGLALDTKWSGSSDNPAESLRLFGGCDA